MNDEQESENLRRPGVFLIKGMRVDVPEIAITLGPNGQLSAEMKQAVRVGLDLCPTWMRIALDHLKTTEEAKESALGAFNDGNSEAFGEFLQAEFSAGMQAIMASAISIDAYYAATHCRGSRCNFPFDSGNRGRGNEGGWLDIDEGPQAVLDKYSKGSGCPRYLV